MPHPSRGLLARHVPPLRSLIELRATLLFGMLVLCCTRCRSVPPKEPEPLPVKKASEEVVVAAWCEPKQLPPGGGQAQILVRAQKRGGAPFPGVEVRILTSSGSLFSQSGILVTDQAGRTRDRLTTRRPATITVNAGGTLYRFRVPIRSPEAEASAPPSS